jgi:phosphatidylinositol 4-kinase
VNKLILPSLSKDAEETSDKTDLEVGDEEEEGKEEMVESQTPQVKRMTTLGNTPSPLSKDEDLRREVLNSIMMKGMRGGNTIATGAATSMQRHLQRLDQRRAVELLMTGDNLFDPSGSSDEPGRQELLSLGIQSVNSESRTTIEATEESDTMEAIRLLLIQYHVAQGTLSLNDAAQALAPGQNFMSKRKFMRKRGEFETRNFNGREFPEIDAGDVDPRLVGCGVLPPAVLQALSLWKGNVITNGELLELVKKDLEYVRVSVQLEENKDKLNEDSAFWQRFAFGERWAEKRSRIAAKSLEAAKPGYDLTGVIVKSNDDLRQEAFVMQLIELCQEAFQEAELELWLLPYRILPTGRTTGIIEMVRNAMSFDALKKRPGYGKGGLKEHLFRMTQFAADPGEAFKSAKRNFVRSLAAYSLLSYLFMFKDRHNGNLLLDTAGHVIHIDFGFVFGVAPGGSFSLEMSTPFKLTEEMIDVMDGLRSSLFSEFVTLFCCGFLALQAHCETFVTLVDITCKGSTYKCFEGRDSAEVVEKLRHRFCKDKGKEETIAFVLDIIKEATSSYGTKQYDYFQYLSQGIAA